MTKYFKLVADNRKARFDFTILEVYKAGLILTGSEVKSVRLGNVNLKDSFGRVDKSGAIWIYGLHISPYGSAAGDPLRPRKILLNKRELLKLAGKTAEKGLTLIPLKLYFEGNWAKVDLGLAKSKKKYEKREALRLREVKREIEGAVKGKIRPSSRRSRDFGE